MKKYHILFLLIPMGLIIALIILPPSKRKEEYIVYANANPYNSTITVNVDGEVLRKGKYCMYKNQTILDLLVKCGQTDLTSIDNSMINDKLVNGATYTFAYKLDDISISVKEPTISSLQTEKLNINTATKEELMSLAGIGLARAEAIIAFRQQKPFDCIEELMSVSGISQKVYDEIKNKITV